MSIKIILFLILVASAAIVTFVIGPRLRKRSSQAPLEKKARFTLEELSRFDGSVKRPAHVGYGALQAKPVVPPGSSAESAEAYPPTPKASEGYPLRIHLRP